MSEQENKKSLSEESAREQMQNLMDSYRINKDRLEIENGPEWVSTIVNYLVDAIRMGNLEVLDGGEVKHNLVVPKGDVTSIVYRRVNGIALKARDKAKEGFEKDCAFMGSLGDVFPNTMSKLDFNDISIFQRLGQLFMVA